MTLAKKSSFFSELLYLVSCSSIFCKMAFRNSSPERPLVQLKISTRTGCPSETGELESDINNYGTEMDADNKRTQEGPLRGLQTILNSIQGSLLYAPRRGTTWYPHAADRVLSDNGQASGHF